jgi:hypothetical protein
VAADSFFAVEAGLAGFFWLLTFAHRFRCASPIARRAFALRIRWGVEIDLLGLPRLFPVSSARAWRSLASSASMAFSIWLFKGDPFVLEGAQNDDAPGKRIAALTFW